MAAVDDVRDALRAALTRALKAHDRVAAGALRSVLGAIDNAGAADLSAAPPAQAGHIAGGVRGLGVGEVARRVLDDGEVEALVARELAERRAAAQQYDALGRSDDAARLRAEVGAVEAALR